MAKGFAAGFIKKDGRWIGQWAMVEARTRTRALEAAKAQLVAQLGVLCGGEAVARRKVIFIDGICPDGRELLETLFEAMREQPAPDPAESP